MSQVAVSADTIYRAYSVLHVKAFDAELRTFSGMASTPSPDRVGDVVESLGATFESESSLLLYHDSRLPVGIVKFGRPTKDGIPFTGSIPDVIEAGTLRDRVQEAWLSIKYRLLRGVSIGFRAIPGFVETLKSGGMRFVKTELLELSLVSIPANAEATITSIKSFDAGLPEPGEAVIVPQPKSRPVDAFRAVPSARKDVAMTTQDQIKSFEATRQAKDARMVELMSKAADAGTTLDAEQAEEYDGLEAEVKSIDAHLKRLEKRAEQMPLVAKPALGQTQEQGTASRGGVSVVSVKENLPPGIPMARFVICKAASFISMMNGEGRSAVEIAKERYPHNPEIQQLLTKTIVAPGTTTDATWAGPLVYAETITSEFLEFLRPQTILGKFGTNGIPNLRRVPFNSRYLAQTSGGTGYWVGQAKPKPLTKFDFAADTMGFAKVAAISVITEESAKFSSPSAEALVRDSLAAALIARIDTDFVDPGKAAVSNVSPASITNGLTPMSPSGTDAAAVRADIARIVNTYVSGNQNVSSLVFIMPASLAMFAGLMRNGLGVREFPDLGVNGGNLDGFPVITSQYAAKTGGPGNLVIAVNAAEVFLADDGAVTVDISREASVEMNDAPTQDGGAGTGASLVSFWQNNLIGLRAERFINWKKGRTTSVVYMDDVNWGSVGSPS